MAVLRKLFGSAGSTAFGFAFGAAAAPALEPQAQKIRNNQWHANRDLPLMAELLAQGVATGEINREWAENEAGNTGVNAERFAQLVNVFDTGPGVAQAFSLWRRGEIDAAGFRRALKREGIEDEWIAAMEAERDVLLTPAELANARQQGFVTAVRQRDEAGKQGVTGDRADIQFELSGLPLGVGQMQAARNRGLVTDAEFAQAIREGHTKTKYTGLADALRHPILTASEYARLYLKGWISKAERDKGGALSGYTPEQMELLYLGMGNPAANGAMFTAAARGIDGPAGRPVDEAQFLTAVKQSNIRPEYGPMLWQTRFLYPPLFQLTRLVDAGTIDADTAARWARYDRYPPEVVDALHAAWSKPAETGGDPHVTKAQTSLWNTLHRSYVADETDDKTAAATLEALGVAGPAQAAVLKTWKAERALIRKQLTPAQVVKAFKKMVKNDRTGQPWTRNDAIAALMDRGYSLADANTLLDESL